MRKQTPAEPTAAAALVRVIQDDGTLDPRADPKLPKDTLLYLYRTMVQVREFDRRMLALQRQGRIGFYGPILGQEAATVASVAALEPQDWIWPALREGAAAMMRGLPLAQAVAQLIGNAHDRCKGRQMPCHYTVKEGHYVSMSSVIGTQISHAVGAAMAAKIRRDPTVMLGYMGDGATSSNDFHAGMNFAAVMQAPVVLFCQNNHWAISVPLAQQSASETIAIKAKAYGMPGLRVDGNDVLACYVATKAAVDRARRGEGPTLVECLTYRLGGHSSSDDPTKYRDEGEAKVWEARDPLLRHRTWLAGRGMWDAAREEAFLAEAGKRITEAIARVEAATPPAPATLFTDVWARPTALLEDQQRRLEGGLPV